jgi:hypothetical protein
MAGARARPPPLGIGTASAARNPLYLRRKSPRRGAATMSRGDAILRARTGRQCLCSFGGMADMVEHIHVPFGSALFHTSPPRAASSRRLTLKKILDVIRLLLVC